MIWVWSAQNENWGATTHVFRMASVWARGHDICREKCTSIPNSTLDYFNVHSYKLQRAATCASDNPRIQCCLGILVLQMPFFSKWVAQQ